MSEQPPQFGREDPRRFHVAETVLTCKGDVGEELGGEAAHDRRRQTELRLRPTSDEPTIALGDRHLVLAAMLENVAGATHLSLTYLLRRNHPLEVAVALGLTSNRERSSAQSADAISKRSLEAQCRIVFPGMAAVDPAMPLLEGPTRCLRAPYLEVPYSAERLGSRPRPHSLPIASRGALLLPEAGAPILALDRALIGLAQARIDVDLSIKIAPFALKASHLRALVRVR